VSSKRLECLPVQCSMEVCIFMKKMNNKVFIVLAFALVSGCSTVKPDHPSHPADHTLNPIDCTSKAKKEECSAVANLDKKPQKKTAKSDQSEQIDRRAKTTKSAESKKINDDKVKAKSEAPPPAPDKEVVSKPDLVSQKKAEADYREKVFSESMVCVRNNIGKDDVRVKVRAMAYDLAMLCRKQGVEVNAIANATIPLIEQSRAPKKTK